MRITPSATNLLNNLVLQKRERGEKVYNFSAGDIALENHPAIVKAVEHGIKRGLLPYPPIAGITDLRKAAAHWMQKAHGVPYGIENTLVTPGGKFALFAALGVLLQPDDEVLIPAPYWVSYPAIVEVCGGRPIIISAKWKITPELIDKYCTPRTKVLLLNNACNPTGIVYTRDEVQALLACAKKNKLFVISDEVYSNLVYDGKEFVSCGGQDNTLVVQSGSKNFGMSGWRIGFAFGNAMIIREMSNLMTQTTSGTCLASQWAALGALENAESVIAYVKEAMEKRRILFFETLGAKVPLPESAIYAFLPIQEKNSEALCARVLQETGVAMVPGSAFGTEGYVRLSFALPEEDIIAGLKMVQRGVFAL